MISKEEMERKIENLPENIRTAIHSPEVTQNIRSISSSHRLHIDQAGALEEEIMMVMAGIKGADDFVDNIENRLGLSVEEAVNLAVDVNEKVFAITRKSVMDAHRDNEDENTNILRDSLMAEIEDSREPSVPTTNNQQAANSFISDKLTQTVMLPSETSEQKEGEKNQNKPQPQEEKPKSYAADPYREPLN